jgi:hypothetical protein
MVTVEQVNEQRIRLEKELASIGKDITSRFPVSDYLKTAQSNRGLQRWLYSRRTRKLKRALEQITSQYGAHALSLYFKLALCAFISDAIERLNGMKLTDEIIRLYHEWFQRVLDDFSTQPDDYYDYRGPSFGFDVGICSLRDIPVGGAWILETRRVGLRPFFGGGVRQFFDYLQFVILKGRGFAPYFTTHTAPRYLHLFNEQEMDLCYQRVAELMKLRPNVKGYYRRSWFLDPNLENISPKLGYLRKVPLQNGAKLFAACSTQTEVKYALAVSSTRRRLYEQGKYLPTGYAFIWPRKEFLAWADRARRCSRAET